MVEMITVFWKEIADHFNSKRFLILLILVFAVGVFSIYIDAQYIRAAVSDTRFVFLKLYTTSGQGFPLFIFFIAFFMPIVGIALGFDAINSEKNNGTLSRLMAQPIYRDAVINGKFLAGLVTIAIMLTSLVMLVAGVGLWMIGVPPSSEEVARLITFLAISIVYGAFWLALAMMFSIFLLKVATSALSAIAIWILFIFMFGSPIALGQLGLTALIIMQVSPIAIFFEVISILLEPGARTMMQLFQGGAAGVPTSALSLSQSLIIILPHLVSLIGLTVICFAISYIRFMREEIRST
ncbi:ABC transporter permease [Chloroflexota bacterium]